MPAGLPDPVPVIYLLTRVVMLAGCAADPCWSAVLTCPC